MIVTWPIVPLKKILTPISRSESVNPEKTYHILGAHWYAQGLYTKDIAVGAQIRASKLYRIEKGDFVYNRLFAWKGAFAVATDENHGCYVSNEFPSFAVKRDLLDSKYLWRLFSRASIWDDALGLSTGGTPTSRNRLKEEKLLDMEISLPPLDEQRRIVGRIEELAARVEAARELRRKAVEETEALMRSAIRRFIGDEPSEEWIPLSAFIENIENGWSPSCENLRANENEWGVLKVGCVSFGFFNQNENKALLPALEPRPDCEVHPGDFLMSRANTLELVGACAIVKSTRPKLMLSDKIFRFHFKRDLPIDLRFLDYILKSSALRKQIQKGSTGTSPTMKSISKEKVLNLLVPAKDIQEQMLIAAALDNLQSKLNALKRFQAETAAELDALIPAVLERAFRGEL